MSYYRYDAHFGTLTEITEKQFQKIIAKRYILRVYDSYWQKFTDTWFDSRDTISRIFYWESEK